jgi:hypothetical protein
MVFVRRRYGLQVSSLRASGPCDEREAIKIRYLLGKIYELRYKGLDFKGSA